MESAAAEAPTLAELVAEDLPGEQAQPPDERVAPEASEELRFPEIPSDFSLPECEPGTGCFGEECAENGECQSGFCVEHLGEGTCTIACQEECPAGWTCQEVTGGGPDVLFLCVSRFGSLCRPCATSEGCQSAGGINGTCLAYGTQGSFCGAPCGLADECPPGFACKEALSAEGVELLACTALSGSCPCSKKSVAQALSTPCSSGNEFGTCVGTRVCLADGLSECDAEIPAAETCDGLDNDCDDDVDEPTPIEGKLPSLCDDGNDCTEDVCAGADGCFHSDQTTGECKDGNACTAGDHCEAGQCVGLPIVCDDGDPCTDDSCNGLGGCLTAFNTAWCDDGDPCTVADQCSQGECKGVAVDCQCQAAPDCVPYDDGDLCTGTLICDTGKLPHICIVKPGSVPLCPEPPATPAAICQKAHCLPETGACTLIPDHEGYACDEGNPCTIGDSCQEGKCLAGPSLTCNDANPCTDDWCDAEQGCVFSNNAAGCSDGDVCTTQDACVAGKCVGGPPLACDDGNVCNGAETCSKALGCQQGLSLVCDDKDPCNGLETCGPKAGCTEGLKPNCQDGNLCTDDACVPFLGCVYSFNTAECNDGNACTTSDACKLGSCVGSGALTCTDGNACTNDTCNPATGCVFKPNTANCDDGNACTLLDTCSGGMCKGTQAPDCDDGDVCTDDVCDPAVGCKHLMNNAPCTDGNVCTLADMCEFGKCASKGNLQCADGNPCTDDSCHPKNGCLFAPNAVACDDGNACTAQDACAGGLCKPGAGTNCDDGKVCTDDSCDPKTGCQHADNAAACNDGNACTLNDACNAGACKGGGPLTCDDGQKCTADSCHPDSGCIFAPIAPCCGNGKVEAGEQCDEGPANGLGACSADCKQVAPVDVTFTTCGQTGPQGPSQGQCNGVYGGNIWLNGKVTVTNGTQQWAVPLDGTYRIEAWGAKGGNNGGNGARMRGDFVLQGGTVLKIVVGQEGLKAPAEVGSGGGGGSFVARADNSAVIVAGGGGGTGHNASYSNHDVSLGRTDTNGAAGLLEKAGAGGTDGQGGKESYTTGNGTPNGGGGGGFFGNGGSSGAAKGGAAFVNGAAGGNSTGGFGGGGGSDSFVYGCGSSPHGGSGGGGYSGGGAGGDNCNGCGGGAGSFNAGSNQSNSAGANAGPGKVQIIRLP
jgi:hypothetical protein